MNKKIIVIIPIIVIGMMFLVGSLSSSPLERKSDTVFHATLADPKLYIDGVYTDVFTAKEGQYRFTFVPNGSSPQTITITLHGNTVDFSEDFELIGTLQDTGISEYYTWEYDGADSIAISEMQEIAITIDPNGETQGSVSVIILENEET